MCGYENADIEDIANDEELTKPSSDENTDIEDIANDDEEETVRKNSSDENKRKCRKRTHSLKDETESIASRLVKSRRRYVKKQNSNLRLVN